MSTEKSLALPALMFLINATVETVLVQEITNIHLDEFDEFISEQGSPVRSERRARFVQLIERILLKTFAARLLQPRRFLLKERK